MPLADTPPHGDPELLDLVFQQMEEGVVVQDAAGSIVRFNPAACRILGLSADQLSGRTSADPHWRAIDVHGQDLPGEQHPAMQTLRTQEGLDAFIMGVDHAGGTRVWLSVRTRWMDAQQVVVSTFTDITERRVAERALARSEATFRALYLHAPVGIFLTDAQGRTVMMNRAWTDIVGMAMDQPGDPPNWVDLIHPDDQSRLTGIWTDALQRGEPFEATWRILRPSGEARVVEGRAVPLRDPAGDVDGFLGTLMDVTARRAAEEQRDTLFEVAADLFMVVDSRGEIVRVNPATERVLGWSVVAGPGHRVWDAVHPEDLVSLQQAALAIQQGDLSGVVDVRARSREGGWIWLALSIVATDEVGGLFYVTARDVTARMQITQALAERATRDALTGVYNREAFLTAVDRCVAHATEAEPVALVFLDLDGFKSVNDAHGHAVGDAVLRMVAERLSSGVRRDDVVGRIGGDEFTVLLRGLDALDVAQRVADKLAADVACTYTVDDVQVAVGASVGVALGTDASRDAAGLIAQADAAMYRAKRELRRG